MVSGYITCQAQLGYLFHLVTCVDKNCEKLARDGTLDIIMNQLMNLAVTEEVHTITYYTQLLLHSLGMQNHSFPFHSHTVYYVLV